MASTKQNFIPSVNFHLWEPCNMRCKFCFATFQDVKQTILPKGHLPREQAIEVVQLLAEFGFEKITFAGGEPTLCPWLSELISAAKKSGMTTMIVSNGTKLSEAFLMANKANLDWIALSVDSLSDKTNLKAGRAIVGKQVFPVNELISVIQRIHHYGYGLKINTVVHRYNLMEDMSGFISFAQPKRWKILQVMPIKGQNDEKVDDFLITEAEFDKFVNRHFQLSNQVQIVPEPISQIEGSYAMVDPAGRFFDDSKGIHAYSKPIREIGVMEAIKQVNYDYKKFLSRGGKYEWEIGKIEAP